jgi:hypothetical protein
MTYIHPDSNGSRRLERGTEQHIIIITTFVVVFVVVIAVS